MRMLSKTAAEIMRILIHQDDAYITYRKIAGMLDISERSVNTYMKEVSDFCEDKPYQLIRKRGKGICLEAGLYREALLQEFEHRQEPYERRDSRISYIIRTLIESGEPYTAALFSDELFVSPSTIRTDIEKANRELKEQNLEIRQSAGIGIEIKGSEFELRRMLVYLNQKVVSDQKEETGDVPDYRLESAVYQRLQKQYRRNIVDGVVSCCQQLERKIGLQFNDYTFCMLVEYVSCQINRIQMGRCLDESMVRQLTLVEEIADWADCLTRLLNQWFHMNIDPREGLYLYILLLGMEVQGSSRIVRKKFLIEKEIPIEKAAEDMIAYISSIVGKNFNEDPLLQTSMALFLNSSLIRVKFGFRIRNPFLEEIKKTDSAIFSACFTASGEYKNLIGQLPSECEISFMALLFSGALEQKKKRIHTAVIGSGGISMSLIIARKIEMKVPEINVTSVLPAKEGIFIDESQYDLVVTTIPSMKIRHSHVVYTTPLVGEQDVCRLKKACDSLQDIPERKESDLTIGQLIQDDFILLEHETISKEALLYKACTLLKEKGYVEEGFYDDVIRREKIGPSVLGDGVAIPHGIANYVNRPAVVLIRTDDKVEWGDGAVDVIFLLALNFEDIQSTRAFFSAFYEMTMERHSAKDIRKANSVQEIKEIIIKNA